MKKKIETNNKDVKKEEKYKRNDEQDKSKRNEGDIEKIIKFEKDKNNQLIDENRYSVEINSDNDNNDENNGRNINKIIRNKVKLFKRGIDQYINEFDNDIVKINVF